MLMRVVYNSTNTKVVAVPSISQNLPGIQSVIGDSQWLTVVGIDAIGCLLFTIFYLETLEHKGDFVQAAFLLSTVYYAAVWLVFQTTTSLFNPAIAVSVGFNDMWNSFLISESDKLWTWFWIAWIVGPLIGAALAVPFVDFYRKQLIQSK